MKTNNIKLTRYTGVLICAVFFLFSCSKNKGEGPLDKVKKAEATFTKINTAAYPKIFKGDYYDRITITDDHIYVIDNEDKAFRRYSMKSNSWEELNSVNSIFGGIAGYLIYHDREGGNDYLTYHGGSQDQLHMYFPPEYPLQNLRGGWVAQKIFPADGNGERGAISDGKYIYYMGNGRVEKYSKQINRYNPDTNILETIGNLPVKLDKYAQAVSAGNKLFIVGANIESDTLFIAYDLQSQKGEVKPVPSELHSFYGNRNNTLVNYQNYLIYMEPEGTSVALHIFDIEGDQWLKERVEIEMDLFSKASDNASLLLSTSGKLYVAGTKAGEFVLYKVDFEVVEN